MTKIMIRSVCCDVRPWLGVIFASLADGLHVAVLMLHATIATQSTRGCLVMRKPFPSA